MSTNTKIMKSGTEPPTTFELDVAQVNILLYRSVNESSSFSNLLNWKEMHNLKVNYENFTSLVQRFVQVDFVRNVDFVCVESRFG